MPKYSWDGKFLEDDEDCRGLNEDDVIYAILENAKSKISDGEYDFRPGIFRKVIKLATHLYCTNKGSRTSWKTLTYGPRQKNG